MLDGPAAIELRALTKRFGGLLANDAINLRVASGTIHAIIGENGAGKSTAMKMLFGMHRPDSGEILVAGQPCTWRSPADAIRKGIGMVHQHFMLAGPLSALDNILAGAEPVRFGMINRRSARSRLESLSAQYNLPIDWDRPVEELPVGLQQRVEILKLLFRQVEILILDEPTSVLTPAETRDLFENLRKLRNQGKTILLITHKLNEVLSLADRVTIFRSGKVVGEMTAAETTAQELAELMVGRRVALNFQAPPARPRPENALEVTNLGLTGHFGARLRLSDLNFSIRYGEILGIAGVEGNGQSELIQSLLHPAEAASRLTGGIKILGRDAKTWPARKIRELGVAFVPEDRQAEGLLLQESLAENFLLGLQREARFNDHGFLRTGPWQNSAASCFEKHDVRPVNLGLAARALSGGNQQKLIFAREWERQAKLLIAAHPTRGVDVGAIETIHGRIVQARDDGAGVLLISSELDEILALSDRILVMYEGRMVAEFSRGEATESALGLKMGGS